MSETRYDRLVDGQPAQARYTCLGDVTGGIEIGMDMEPTGSASEIRTRTVPFVGMTAPGTLLGRVPGIYENDGLTERFSLVPDKLFQFVERPGIEHPVKGFASAVLDADLGQVFEREDRVIRIDDLLRDTMVHISHKPSLSSAQFTEFPASGSSAFGLEPCPEKGTLSPDVLDGLGVEEGVIGTDRDIDDPPVDPENPLLFDKGRSRNFDLGVKVKHSGLFTVCESGRPNLPAKELPVMVRDSERHSDPPVNSCHGSIPGLRADPDHSLVIPESRVRFPLWKSRTLHSLESFAGTISRALNERGGKFWYSLTNTPIRRLVVLHLVPRLVLESPQSGDRECRSVSLHRLLERCRATFRQPELERERAYHNHIMYLLVQLVFGGEWCGAIPPTVKTVGLLAPRS